MTGICQQRGRQIGKVRECIASRVECGAQVSGLSCQACFVKTLAGREQCIEVLAMVPIELIDSPGGNWRFSERLDEVGVVGTPVLL